MTDAAATPAPAAPAPAAPNGGPPPTVHAGNNFEEFRAQVQARAERLKPPVKVQPAAATQPPTQPAQPTEPTPPAQPTEQPTDPNATPQETAPQPTDPQDPNAPPQITQEDLQLLAKAKEWMASDRMPEEFMKRLVELKNGDEIEYESWEEVRKQRMMQRDYTRAMQQHLREKEAWQQAEAAYKGHFEAIFSDEQDGRAGGDAMYEIYTRAGKRKQLLALGQRLAREEQVVIDAANGMGYAIMQRLGIKDPNDYRVQRAVRQEYARRHAELEREARTRAMAWENEQLKKSVEARQRETQDSEFFAGQRKSLEQLRPRAFTAVGLNHDDPTHRQHFNVYLDAIIRQENANKLTPELVLKAARAAREEVEVQRKKLASAGQAKLAKTPGFQPQLGVGGGAPAGAQPTQWHSDSFAEKFKMPRW